MLLPSYIIALANALVEGVKLLCAIDCLYNGKMINTHETKKKTKKKKNKQVHVLLTFFLLKNLNIWHRYNFFSNFSFVSISFFTLFQRWTSCVCIRTSLSKLNCCIDMFLFPFYTIYSCFRDNALAVYATILWRDYKQVHHVHGNF